MRRSLQYPVPRGAHCWQRVTWRRVALTKKRGKKREIEGSDGKLLVNGGKKREKKKGREEGKGWKEEKLEKTLGKGKELEEEGGKGREREKGRLGSPKGRRPATRYRKRRWNFACHVPSTFARKATMFEPLWKNSKNAGKTRKMQIWAERTLVRSPRQCNFWQPSTRERPGTDSARARVAQQLRKNHRKCHKTDRTQFSPLSKIHQKCLKNMANTTKSCAKSAKIQQKQSKNDNLMSKIDQQRVLCFRNLWASKN